MTTVLKRIEFELEAAKEILLLLNKDIENLTKVKTNLETITTLVNKSDVKFGLLLKRTSDEDDTVEVKTYCVPEDFRTPEELAKKGDILYIYNPENKSSWLRLDATDYDETDEEPIIYKQYVSYQDMLGDYVEYIFS